MHLWEDQRRWGKPDAGDRSWSSLNIDCLPYLAYQE